MPAVQVSVLVQAVIQLRKNKRLNKGEAMSRDQILGKLRDNGCRITKQRELIVDVIISNDHSSCKDICNKVMSRDDTVGMATVYRMIRVLEDIGVLNRIDMIEINN